MHTNALRGAQRSSACGRAAEVRNLQHVGGRLQKAHEAAVKEWETLHLSRGQRKDFQQQNGVTRLQMKLN